MSVSLKRRVGRRLLRALLSPLLRWKPLVNPQPGYSIILGVPWNLRHLLAVNLNFVAKTDLSDLRRLHVVFDRTPQEGADELIAALRRDFPQLPLEFHFYPLRAGRFVEKINVSTWFNSMNCVTALKAIDTKYAVLHDFDLYPLVPNYFQEVVDAMRKKSLHFCGLELTNFDGLRDDDRIIGTWCLGMDVQWLKANFKPIEIFQRVGRIDDRLIQLDPFSYLQTLTPQRDLVHSIDGSHVCHVRNLVGTYVRYKTGRNPDFVWRLHYLWYLETFCGLENRMKDVISAMQSANSGVLKLGEFETDFSQTHSTCANVLRGELNRMEHALFNECRSEVTEYVDEFQRFLERHGDNTPVDRYVKARM